MNSNVEVIPSALTCGVSVALTPEVLEALAEIAASQADTPKEPNV